jgi:ethanolamine transporter EutH
MDSYITSSCIFSSPVNLGIDSYAFEQQDCTYTVDSSLIGISTFGFAFIIGLMVFYMTIRLVRL